MAHDLVTRNANVVDGTGAEAFAADIAVDGDTITAIGKVSGKGSEEINAVWQRRHSRFYRPAHPPRRPDRLGSHAHVRYVARRYDSFAGQLWFRVRALSP